MNRDGEANSEEAQLTSPNTVKPDLRERLSEKLNQLSDKQLDALVNLALTAEKTAWVTTTCKGCGKVGRYEVPVPDVQARAKALDILLTQGKGKPPEGVRVEATVTVKRVEEMTSLAELEAEERRILKAHPELQTEAGKKK